MKRECLLSRAYTGPPAMLDDVELIFCAVANDINREMLEESKDETDYFAVSQSIFIMFCLGKKDAATLHGYRALSPDERRRFMRGFMIDRADGLAALFPLIKAKMESAIAASVESEAAGKSQAQPPDFSPS